MNAAMYQERRRLAQTHLDEAKRQFSEAAQAALRRDPSSPELARLAFDAVNSARAELRALDVEQLP